MYADWAAACTHPDWHPALRISLVGLTTSATYLLVHATLNYGFDPEEAISHLPFRPGPEIYILLCSTSRHGSSSRKARAAVECDAAKPQGQHNRSLGKYLVGQQLHESMFWRLSMIIALFRPDTLVN